MGKNVRPKLKFAEKKKSKTAIEILSDRNGECVRFNSQSEQASRKTLVKSKKHKNGLKLKKKKHILHQNGEIADRSQANKMSRQKLLTCHSTPDGSSEIKRHPAKNAKKNSNLDTLGRDSLLVQNKSSSECAFKTNNINSSNKRKRSSGSQAELSLKKMKLESDSLKGTDVLSNRQNSSTPLMTRKQRRNRKKTNSKKNKYKHLALRNDDNKLGLQTTVQAVACKNSAENFNTKTKADKNSSVKKCDFDSSEMPEPEKIAFPPGKHRQSGKNLKEVKKLKQKDKKNSVTKHATTETASLQKTLHRNNVNCSCVTSEAYDEDSSRTAQKETVSMHVDKVSKTGNSSNKNTTQFSMDKAQQKLTSARFRYINEQLYTSTGAEAMQMFQDDPEAFQVYHSGFQAQLSRWPLNPLDVIIKQLSKMSHGVVIADFGCGDGRLAQSLPQHTVHSFDLVAVKPFITACDIAKVPLEKNSIDVAVFCLSLMGTNLSNYICEANRVLRIGGMLKIAEVISRFLSVGRFVRDVEAIGFSLQKKVFLEKMFMLFTFKKVKDASRRRAPKIELKVCQYKRR